MSYLSHHSQTLFISLSLSLSLSLRLNKPSNHQNYYPNNCQTYHCHPKSTTTIIIVLKATSHQIKNPRPKTTTTTTIYPKPTTILNTNPYEHTPKKFITVTNKNPITNNTYPKTISTHHWQSCRSTQNHNHKSQHHKPNTLVITANPPPKLQQPMPSKLNQAWGKDEFQYGGEMSLLFWNSI